MIKQGARDSLQLAVNDLQQACNADGLEVFLNYIDAALTYVADALRIQEPTRDDLCIQPNAEIMANLMRGEYK